MTTLELQKALKAKGFDPGAIDGVMGRDTIAAIRAFQAANGLEVDGIAGKDTRAKLAATEVQTAADPIHSLSMPWFIEAQRAIGVKEDTGPGSNPLIIGWRGGCASIMPRMKSPGAACSSPIASASPCPAKC